MAWRRNTGKQQYPLDVIPYVMGMKGTRGLIFFSFEWSWEGRVKRPNEYWLTAIWKCERELSNGVGAEWRLIAYTVTLREELRVYS